MPLRRNGFHPNAFVRFVTSWEIPSKDTRLKLLQGLSEKGFGADQLDEMQHIIGAEKSDIFDVLAHVAYALPPLTGEERTTNAKVDISAHFNTKQQAFLDFVLSQYVKVGVGVADLGRPEEIGKIFVGFQKYLYQDAPQSHAP
jgi:type I restriction enzyme, R subunit